MSSQKPLKNFQNLSDDLQKFTIFLFLLRPLAPTIFHVSPAKQKIKLVWPYCEIETKL